jgi:hypothetical protein
LAALIQMALILATLILAALILAELTLAATSALPVADLQLEVCCLPPVP